ncbi:hypothetical protein HC928_13520 [bacterium]|nr:hypothetical protein [bacterium]
MTEQRQDRYLDLIDRLLKCPNGQEPEVLNAESELIDEGLIKTMMQVATVFAHKGNQDGSKFLIHVARVLAKQLGLYPDLAEEDSQAKL